ncbi:MAG: GDP-mannose 4,6-dehydratase [candidate division WOR-3 bacterium]|nr:GDP-mannose 4,6-dehydratase [candidate division WOR-3 bacterium]
MKNILITGIEGFVGTHLSAYLKNQGYQVSGIYFQTPQQKLGQLFKADIRDYPTILNIIKKIKADGIFHLAAQSSVAQSEKNIKDTFSINIEGTLNILEAVRNLDLKTRIIFISSCEVYGNQKVRLAEKSATKPISFYAVTKLCAENICQYYERRYGLDIVILRPFSHTGFGQAEHFLFPRITKQIAEIEAGLAKPILNIGNLKVRRDYLDISDVVRAYELAMRKCRSGEIYNITSEKSYSIKEALDYLLKLSTVSIKVHIDKQLVRKYDIALLTGKADKFKKTTGWQPKVNFFTTLKNLLEYYRQKIIQ